MPSTKRPASPLRNVFGRRLRAARQARQMTIADLAYAAHMDWSYLTQLELGKKNPSLDLMDSLAHAVGIRLKDMLDS